MLPLKYDEGAPSGALAVVLDELRRPWVTGVSAAFLAIAVLAGLVPPRLAAEQATVAGVAAGVKLACTVAVFVLSGAATAFDTAREVAAGNVNIYVLTSLAVFGTVLLGCALEGALLLVLFGAAHLVEDELTGRAQQNLRALWESVPTEAFVLPPAALEPARRNGTAMDSSTSEDEDSRLLGVDCGAAVPREASMVRVGELLLVRAGQQVPLDGTVVAGTAMVSTQKLTGEDLPHQAAPGDELPAGAMNCDGVLVLRAVRLSEESLPARIARLTDSAQRRAPRLQTFIQSFGEPYSKAVLAATALFIFAAPMLLGLPLVGGAGDVSGGAIYRAFGFLTAAAPCALFMAPLVYVVALGRCARGGVLVHNARTLEALAETRTFLMDKTGTLTTGKLMCIGVERLEDAVQHNGASMRRALFAPSTGAQARALAVAEAFERAASHPIARAVVQCHAQCVSAVGKHGSVAMPEVQLRRFKQVHGRGVEGTAQLDSSEEEMSVVLGSLEYVAEHCTERANREGMAQLVAQASSHVTVAMRAGYGESEQVTVLYLADTVRDSSCEAVASLKAASWRGWANAGADGGCRVEMLTGDRRESALEVGDMVGIGAQDVHAGLLPEDKLARVEAARTRGAVVMVGDGINDAPALAAADVGIAVSRTPSEASAAAADIVLLRQDASVLPELMTLVTKMRIILRQNLWLAALSIAGAALPALGGMVPIWIAVCMHEGATLLVAINSLRLLSRASMASLRAEAVQWLVRNRMTVGVVAALAVLAGAAVLGYEAFGAAALAGASASLFAGLCTGCLHTLTGPDHLAALMPLSVGVGRAHSALLGALWGLGHDTGQVLFGVAFIVLRERMHFDMDALGQFGTLAVAATLIIIGASGLWERMRGGHSHGHGHGHHHHHHDDEIDVEGKTGMRKLATVYGTGLVHGLQPDALLVITPAFAMPTLNAACFLTAFLVGTVVAMGTYTAFIAKSVDIVAKTNGQRGVDRIAFLSAAIALGVGVLLVVGTILGVDII